MESSGSNVWYFLTLYALVVATHTRAAMWRWRGGRWAGCRAVILSLAFAAPLGVVCSWVLPGYHGLVLFSCGYWLSYVVLGGRADALSVDGRAVLITGCDTGFGHALAKLLDSMGLTVFAGVLDEEGPGALALRRGGSEKLRVLQLDVTDSRQIERAYGQVRSQVGEAGLWGLVNNAGILGYLADGEILPMGVYRKCLAVNFLAAVEMSQIFLPLLRRAKGRLVNISSMAGDVPIPGFSAYGASKAALNSFSGVMRQELARWGVQVVVVQPAGFRTNIFGSRTERSRHQEELLGALSPDARDQYGKAYIASLEGRFDLMSSASAEDLRPVLEAIRHALMAAEPRFFYYPGRSGRIVPLLYRVCPAALYDATIGSLFQFHNSVPAGLQHDRVT